MRVLFVSRGNYANKTISPIIKAQGESIRNLGVSIEYFPIYGKGLKGYLSSGLKIRKFLKNNNFDLIHAHYTLSGWAALIGSRKIPIILSLMGSDTYGEFIGENRVKLWSRFSTLLTLMIQPFVSIIISKSLNIEKFVYYKRKSIIIPNGINIEVFKPKLQNSYVDLGLAKHKQYILFLGNKEEIRKNFSLLKSAYNMIANNNVIIINPFPIAHNEVAKYLNNVDVMVLSSFAEGSPNVIKEAMACNCPIVATDAGDVSWVIDDTEGCFITSFKPLDMANKLKDALLFAKDIGRTEGRKRIIDLQLDSTSVARKLIKVYKGVISS